MGHGLATSTMILGGLGLNWLIQSSVLLALGLLAGRLLRRTGPAVQSAVYRTTLAAVLVCPAAAAVLTAAGFGGFTIQLLSPEPVEAPPAVAVVRPVIATTEATVRSSSHESLRPSGIATRGAAVRSVAIAPEPGPGPLPIRPPIHASRSWTRAAAVAPGLGVWLMGSTVLGLRLVIGHWRMGRLKALAIPAEPSAEALCRDLAARLRLRPPVVLRSPFLFSPCLDGLRRPAILLPDDVSENLRETFVHELAHLARRDGLWNFLRRWGVAALWVQPLLWVLSRRLEVSAEEVCDDYVVQFGGDRARYAGHLLELAGRALPQVSPAGVGMISIRSLLGRRIVRILDPSRALSTRAGTRAVLVMLVMGLAGTFLAGLVGVGEGKRSALAQTGEKAKAAPPDVPINGRIVDLEGRPVAGVSVKVGGVRFPKADDLTTWLAGVKKGEPPWVAAQVLDWNREPPEAAGREAVTDTGGRFRLGGFGAERVVELTLQGDRIACTNIDVVTRTMAPIPAPGFHNEYGPGVQTIYGADFIFTASASRPIEGVVRDARTREPMAGVRVESYGFAGSNFIGTATLKTISDAQGRFRLAGMPKGKGNKVLAVPDDDQPYFQREVAVGDPPGIEPVPLEIELHRGIWITGKVTDKATGEPLQGARLHYLPFLENTFVHPLSEFDKDGDVDGDQTRYTTRADGTYKLVGMPGRAIVGVQNLNDGRTYLQGAGSEIIIGMNQSGHFETYRNPIKPGKLWPTAMKEINPSADADVVHLDFQLTMGPSLRFKVVDTEGNPVIGVATHGRTGRSSYESEDMSKAEGEVTNLMPGEDRIVLLRHAGRKLGKVVRVREGDDANGPVVVTLEPLSALTGRVADADGNPFPGAIVRPDVLPGGDFSLSLPNVATDENGRFHVPDVPTGCTYSLAIDNMEAIKRRLFAFSTKDIAVKPGETTEVGEIKFKKD